MSLFWSKKPLLFRFFGKKTFLSIKNSGFQGSTVQLETFLENSESNTGTKSTLHINDLAKK